jgi:hypothetical protein
MIFLANYNPLLKKRGLTLIGTIDINTKELGVMTVTDHGMYLKKL